MSFSSSERQLSAQQHWQQARDAAEGGVDDGGRVPGLMRGEPLAQQQAEQRYESKEQRQHWLHRYQVSLFRSPHLPGCLRASHRQGPEWPCIGQKAVL